MVRRGLRVLMLTVGMATVVGGMASAEPLPPYEGMSFPMIQDAAGPEEFSWVVKLQEEQELRAIDETHAAVYYTEPGEHIAFSIEAAKAHAADGANVPTTLVVTQPNVITLTVHHRAGNSAAGGAPFAYPISQGAGWEGWFRTSPVDMGPPAEEQVDQPACEVPKLKHRGLREARKMLKGSDCALGEIRGRRGRASWIVRQFPRPYTLLPFGAKVDIKFGSNASAGVRALGRR